MKKKYRVTTQEVHAYDWDVFAESREEALQKVQEGDGEPVPVGDDTFLYSLESDLWDVEICAPISSTKFSKGGRV